MWELLPRELVLEIAELLATPFFPRHFLNLHATDKSAYELLSGVSCRVKTAIYRLKQHSHVILCEEKSLLFACDAFAPPIPCDHLCEILCFGGLNIQALNAGRNAICDIGVSSIIDTLSGYRLAKMLRFIGLADNAIDTGAYHLVKHAPNAEKIYLECNSITNATMAMILKHTLKHGLRKLNELDVSKNPLNSIKAAELVKRHFPRLKFKA